MHGMGPGPLQHDPTGMGGYGNVALSPAQDPQQHPGGPGAMGAGGNNNLMANSGLPPMSTFRNSSAVGGVGGVPVQPGPGGAVQSPSMYSHSPNLGPVATGPGGQTSGDALGKALASVSVALPFFSSPSCWSLRNSLPMSSLQIYSADQSTSSFSSHPTTPVSSPPPLTSVNQTQWNNGPPHASGVVTNANSTLYNDRNLHMVSLGLFNLSSPRPPPKKTKQNKRKTRTRTKEREEGKHTFCLCICLIRRKRVVFLLPALFVARMKREEAEEEDGRKRNK